MYRFGLEYKKSLQVTISIINVNISIKKESSFVNYTDKPSTHQENENNKILISTKFMWNFNKNTHKYKFATPFYIKDNPV